MWWVGFVVLVTISFTGACPSFSYEIPLNESFAMDFLLVPTQNMTLATITINVLDVDLTQNSGCVCKGAEIRTSDLWVTRLWSDLNCVVNVSSIQCAVIPKVLWRNDTNFWGVRPYFKTTKFAKACAGASLPTIEAQYQEYLDTGVITRLPVFVNAAPIGLITPPPVFGPTTEPPTTPGPPPAAVMTPTEPPVSEQISNPQNPTPVWSVLVILTILLVLTTLGVWWCTKKTGLRWQTFWRDLRYRAHKAYLHVKRLFCALRHIRAFGRLETDVDQELFVVEEDSRKQTKKLVPLDENEERQMQQFYHSDLLAKTTSS